MNSISAIQPRRFLFVLWDGGGNIPPQLAVARHLVARGHEVRILGPRVLKQRIEAAGGVFVPYHRAPEHDSASPERDLIQDWGARTPLGALARARDRVMVGPALAFAQDVLDTLEQHPMDIVATDYMLLGAFLGAERAALPTAALVHHIYPFPAPALPAFGMGFPPARGATGRLRDALFRRMFVRFFDAALPRLNAARVELGLVPQASVFDLFSHLDRVLVLSSRAFDFPAAALPGNVRYVGSQFDAPSAAMPWAGPWAADDPRPLVVVSFSTTVQRQGDLLHRVIAALAELPIRALVTVGPAVDTGAYQELPNVVIRSYVPHQQVFPQADLVITHGGHGTVLTALAHGVPVLCLPMGRDQNDVAARVVWRGAGLALSPRSNPNAVRQAVQRILDEPHFRDGARRIADGMARGEGESSVVEELEALYAPTAGQRLSLKES